MPLKPTPGVNDVATTDPERSKMFVDPEVAKTVTRGSTKKAWFRCLDDDSHPNWEASTGNVFTKRSGCPTCSRLRCAAKIRCVAGVNDAATTDPERSKMFVDPGVAKTVTRGSNKKVTFQCSDDPRHQWEASVSNVIARGQGCGVCRGLQVVTGVNDVATTDPKRAKMFVDPEVAKTVTRGSDRKALFQCLNRDDHPIWEATVRNVVGSTNGCPTCSGTTVAIGINDVATTDPERSKMFADPEVAKTVTRSSSRKAWFQCLEDSRHPNWVALVSDTIAGGHACPACCNRLCVTGVNDVVTTDPERAKMFADPEVAKTVTRSTKKKAWFQCLKDGSHPNWEASVSDVVSGGTGCPSCAISGFDPSKPATLYVLDATTHIVYGITGNLDQRLKSYDDSRVLLHRFDSEDGGEARRVETEIKRRFKHCRYDESDLPGEMSESLTLDCLADLLAFLNGSPLRGSKLA